MAGASAFASRASGVAITKSMIPSIRPSRVVVSSHRDDDRATVADALAQGSRHALDAAARRIDPGEIGRAREKIDHRLVGEAGSSETGERFLHGEPRRLFAK